MQEAQRLPRGQLRVEQRSRLSLEGSAEQLEPTSPMEHPGPQVLGNLAAIRAERHGEMGAP